MLLLDRKRYWLLYILFVAVLLIIDTYRFDMINVGIVEKVYNDHCIVSKLFYKVKVIGASDVNVNDVLLFPVRFRINKYTDELQKNILFYGKEHTICSVSCRES